MDKDVPGMEEEYSIDTAFKFRLYSPNEVMVEIYQILFPVITS